VSISEDKGESIIGADIIFLSVKLQDMFEVFNEIRNFVKRKAIIISIAPGITTRFIEDNIQKNVVVIRRVMSNTPSLVLSGATALCKRRFVSDEQLQKVECLFSAIGKAEILDEEEFDIITALSGFGHAYIFYFCELMQKSAEKLGLDKDVAKRFAVQTVYGAGKMLDVTKEFAATLKEKVKSPNGTTEAALDYFESKNLSNMCIELWNRL
jgi:pyrroline-5-carboxylate reductase